MGLGWSKVSGRRKSNSSKQSRGWWGNAARSLTDKAAAQRAYTSWPAYRVSQGETRSFQWRLNDCFRQQRFPEPKYASQAVTNLIAYMTGNANGQMYKGPGIKR